MSHIFTAKNKEQYKSITASVQCDQWVIPFCFKVCIFQHNTAVVPPNMVILTMYSVVREYTTPVKTSSQGRYTWKPLTWPLNLHLFETLYFCSLNDSTKNEWQEKEV